MATIDVCLIDQHRYVMYVKRTAVCVGLWHFQAAVLLQSGSPYVVHTKLTDANKEARKASHTVNLQTK